MTPHHTTPHHYPRSFLQSDFLSPINVLLFFSAAVTESPALFPVVKARCLVTAEGGVFIAEGAFAEGREVNFLSLTGPTPALTWAQHRATAPRDTQHFTISQLWVVAALAPHARGRLHKSRMELV